MHEEWTDRNSDTYLDAESELLDEGRVFFDDPQVARAFADAFPVNSGGWPCELKPRNREGTYAVVLVRE